MTQPRAPYSTRTTPSQATLNMLSLALWRWMMMMLNTPGMELYRIGEDDWRRVCQAAICKMCEGKEEDG